MMNQLIVHTTAGGIVEALDTVPRRSPFGVVVTDVDAVGFRSLRTIAHSHRELLARWCVGVVAVIDDPASRRLAAGFAGLLPFPFTAVADDRDAAGWLAGQHAAGLAGVRPAGGGRTVAVTPEIDDYLLAHLNPPPDAVSADLAARTAVRFGVDASMNVGEDQGRMLQLLVQVTGAMNVVEVGTFTGMSALWLARGLPQGGRLTCYEIDPAGVELAEEAWDAAGVADRITVVIGPAGDRLAELPVEPVIDLAFVDADKAGYARYVDELLPRMRPGGIILIDNTLWGGAVVHPTATDESTLALRALNDDLATREGLDVFTLPIGDGLTFVRHRSG